MPNFTLDFDANTYSLLTIQKACHRCLAQASFEIRQLPERSVIEVTVVPRQDGTNSALRRIINDEALDQHLREVVRAETAGVRNLILAHAFSRTGLIHEDGPPPGTRHE